MNFFLLIISLVTNIYIIYYILSIFNRIKNPIRFKLTKIDNKLSITDFYGFKTSYGLGVDNKENIYIPDFKSGLIYKIKKNCKQNEIYKLKNNKLIRISFFEKFIAFSFLQKIFKILGNIYKPHDIFFDKKNYMYISEMGNGNEKGGGKISIFSNNKKLVSQLGISFRNNKGLIDPVMTYVKNNFLYVSECGTNKILRYKKLNFFDWIGDIDHKVNDNSFNKDNLFFTAKLNKPHGFKIGPDKNFYIVDSNNHRICKFSSKGIFLGWIGKRDDGSINSNWSKKGKSIKGKDLGAFNTPIDLVFYKNFIILSDCFNHRLVKISLSGKSLMWFGENNYNDNLNLIWKKKGYSLPSKSSTGLYKPFSLKVTKNKIFIADKQNLRIKVLKFNQFY